MIPGNCVFRPNAQKLNTWFLKNFEKYAKIMHFPNFLKKLFENFRKFYQNFIFSNNEFLAIFLRNFLNFRKVFPPPRKKILATSMTLAVVILRKSWISNASGYNCRVSMGPADFYNTFNVMNRVLLHQSQKKSDVPMVPAYAGRPCACILKH